MQVYRGDTGKFRLALSNAGFIGSSRRTIFNDVAKVRGYRRMKLWFAEALQAAPQKQQEKLVNEIKSQFGDRFISVYLMKNPGWVGGGWALCLRVKP